MDLRLKAILDTRAWIALAGCLLAGLIIYAGLIQTSLDLYSRHEEAALNADRAQRELAGLRSRYESLQHEIIQREQRLAELGGSPPPVGEQDLQVAHITSIANASRVTIDQYLPIGSVDEDDHRAGFLQFTARGSFAAVQNFFRKLEAQVDFVDITHFSIAPGQADVSGTCRVTWSCRINAMRPEAPAPRRDQRADPPPREVVLHAP